MESFFRAFDPSPRHNDSSMQRRRETYTEEQSSSSQSPQTSYAPSTSYPTDQGRDEFYRGTSYGNDIVKPYDPYDRATAYTDSDHYGRNSFSLAPKENIQSDSDEASDTDSDDKTTPIVDHYLIRHPLWDVGGEAASYGIKLLEDPEAVPSQRQALDQLLLSEYPVVFLEHTQKSFFRDNRRDEAFKHIRTEFSPTAYQPKREGENKPSLTPGQTEILTNVLVPEIYAALRPNVQIEHIIQRDHGPLGESEDESVKYLAFSNRDFAKTIADYFQRPGKSPQKVAAVTGRMHDIKRFLDAEIATVVEYNCTIHRAFLGSDRDRLNASALAMDIEDLPTPVRPNVSVPIYPFGFSGSSVPMGYPGYPMGAPYGYP